MPGKNKGSAMVVDRMPLVRKARSGDAIALKEVPGHRHDTREMLAQIKMRGETLSAEIKELLVRMG